MTEEATVIIRGRPITEEIQMIFGQYGVVQGIAVGLDDTGAISVQYEGGLNVTFVPQLLAVKRAPAQAHDPTKHQRRYRK